ncbi:peptidase S8/S53 domain-containing protein [Powellomyces hirtus]|nr:peptidase S8/S53 domain-containing protein [Powellomyces hirtus]
MILSVGNCLSALLALTGTLVCAARLGDKPTTLNDHANFHYLAVQLAPFDKAAEPAPSAWEERARAVGDSLGYHVVGRVGELPDYYMFATEKWTTSAGVGPLEVRSEAHLEKERRLHEREIATAPYVVSAKAQIPTIRLHKRGPIPQNERGRPFRLDELRKELGIHDPGFGQQWHLINTVIIGNDLNVTGVWKQGITGHNATVCFVDDGLDFNNPDLAENFYAEGSYDYNVHVKTPEPKLPEDRHGTRCAGEVAAVRNDVCGVGVAYNAKVSGVRILGGALTEADEAAAINYDYQNNHIYSCSWGPSDDGRSMEAPPQIVTDAVYNGIANGRGGLGSIFVFASGNGAASSDHCNADGYTNSIYTITVGALDRSNTHPVYSEACSAVMIVMYSSSGQRADAIYTTDWPGNGCTDAHGGTSAAAPLASGVYALVLQIRPDLTWRDMQHLTVENAVPVDLTDDGWEKTAVGRPFNNKYGYGKLDAYKLVEAAKRFQHVRPQTHIVSPVAESNKEIPHDFERLDSIISITEEDIKKANMSRIEHITVHVTIEHDSRGDIEMFLVSPHGIVSQLSTFRPRDSDPNGYQNWTLMTVKHWGEDPVGDWKFQVTDRIHPSRKGTLKYWWMTVWGETAPPTVTRPTIPPVSALLPGPSTSTSSASEPSETDTDLQPPSLPSLPTSVVSKTTTLARPTATGEPAASETTVPVPTASRASGAYALVFGAAVLGAAGGGFYYIRRKRAADSSVEQDYEFEMLNDDEVDAAFDDEEDERSEMRLVDENRGPIPDRFVLSSMDEEEDEQP